VGSGRGAHTPFHQSGWLGQGTDRAEYHRDVGLVASSGANRPTDSGMDQQEVGDPSSTEGLLDDADHPDDGHLVPDDRQEHLKGCLRRGLLVGHERGSGRSSVRVQACRSKSVVEDLDGEVTIPPVDSERNCAFGASLIH
jgi:hypothetical protein